MPEFCRLFLHSSESMPELRDRSVQMTLTAASYPGKYLDSVLKEVERVTRDNGVFILNIGNAPPDTGIGREILRNEHRGALDLLPYRTVALVLDKTGFRFQNDFIMLKDSGFLDGHFIENYEHFLLFSKQDDYGFYEKDGVVGTAWLQHIEPESLKAAPLPFPEEIVATLLNLFTRPWDLVLDPMAGSGTLGKIAVRMERAVVLYEKDPSLLEVIKKKIGHELTVEQPPSPAETK